MKTKTISLLLVLTLCLLMLAGCQSTELHSLSEEAAAEAGENSEPVVPDIGPVDYTLSYEAYPEDEVMLTVDGVDITWGELFYWYYYDISNLESYFGTINDWNAENAAIPEKSNAEYLRDNALEAIKNYCSLERKSQELGTALNEVDEALLEASWQNAIEGYGGSEEALLEYLKTAFLSKTVFQHISKVNLLYSKVIEQLYGQNGENISDEELYKTASEMGYIRVKHILISTFDETNTELPADQLAEKKARADELYAELSAISDAGAREARLDELISAEGNDPGTAYYTGGYTFVSGAGTMEQSFEAAAAVLGEGELSEPVKSGYGYHIIMRLPLDREVPVNVTSETEFTTLGYYVMQELFNAEAQVWAQEAAVETTKAYDKLDLAAVLQLSVDAAIAKAAEAAAEPTAEPSGQPSAEPEE